MLIPLRPYGCDAGLHETDSRRPVKNRQNRVSSLLVTRNLMT